MKRKQSKLSNFLSPEGVKVEKTEPVKGSFSNAWHHSAVVKDEAATGKKRILPSTISKVPANNSSYSAMATSFRPLGGNGEPRRTNDYGDEPRFNKAKSKPTNPADDDVSLSASQKKVLDTIMARKSVFFTGAAGTGKSYILKVLRDVLEGVGFAEKISFTAPTGVAACNIRGLTIHAWAGVGTAAEPKDQLAAQVARSRVAAQRWKETEILVIDEISMVSAELFDKLSFIGSRVRGDPRPFGGLQLILCGDFFQLPPIGVGKNTHFCFESTNWDTIFGGREDGMILLDKVFRQQNDSVFLNILNDLRQGVVTPQAQRILGGKVQQSYLRDRETAAAERTASAEEVQLDECGNTVNTPKVVAVRPTKLFSTNKDVDSFNASEMVKLSQADRDGDVYRYEAIDEGTEPFLNQLRQGTKAPALLELRIGAQVMLLKNISTARGLVNGARGTVVGFEKSLNRTANTAMIPLVKFQIYLGSKMTEETVSLDQETWDIRQGEKILASRVQIPLMLAWAISIHKSQGMTIPLLEVSFNGIFEYGQGYVALSRATCLEGLTLRSFQVSSIKAHGKVADFYTRIATMLPAAATAPTNPDGTAQEITTKVSLFARAFVKEAPHEDTSDQWMETNRAVSTLKAAVSTYKGNVRSESVDPSMYGKIVTIDDEDEEPEEELSYLESKKPSGGAHSGATQPMSTIAAPSSSASFNTTTSARNLGSDKNRFSDFSCDNEWLDGDTTKAQRDQARIAYAKQALNAEPYQQAPTSYKPAPQKVEAIAKVEPAPLVDDSFTQWSEPPLTGPFSPSRMSVPGTATATSTSTGAGPVKNHYVHGPFSPPHAGAHAFVPPNPPPDVMNLYDIPDSPTPVKAAPARTFVPTVTPAMNRAAPPSISSVWGSPPPQAYPAPVSREPVHSTQPVKQYVPGMARSFVGSQNQFSQPSVAHAPAPIPSPAPSLMQMLRPQLPPVSLSYPYGTPSSGMPGPAPSSYPPAQQSISLSYPYGAPHSAVPAPVSAPSAYPPAQQAPLSEDLQRRMEKNRQAALEKLRASRQRSEDEANRMLQQYQI